jgi:hypothetical protein
MFNRGDVIKFNYEAGKEPGQRIAKVLSVRDTRENPVHIEAFKARPNLERSRYLVTAKQADTRIRSFYTDEMSAGVKCVGLIGRIGLYLTGVRF